MSTITRTEVKLWLTRKNATGPCAACGTQQWMVPNKAGTTGDDAIEASMLASNRLEDILPFTPAICMNCGNTRFFHVETIRNGMK